MSSVYRDDGQPVTGSDVPFRVSIAWIMLRHRLATDAETYV